MSDKRVTVAIVPRERFSHTAKTIQSVIDNTQMDYDFVYVDGKTPEPVLNQIQNNLERSNAKIVSSHSYISPNAARNLALNATNTEYIVFLDNDTLVGPRWLDAMIACADQTHATQVGPLQFIGDFTHQRIHIAGGMLHEHNENGRKVLYDEQKLFEAKLKSLKEPLPRSECDYIEFHCMLLRRDFLERIGGLDEELLSIHEHIDLGLELRRHNQTVYFEPGSLATYIPPQVIPWFDLPYFEVRWCEDWTVRSVNHFRKKWDFDRLGYMGEQENPEITEDTIVKFVRGHRGAIVGTHLTAEMINTKSELNQEEVELIVSAFLSVECNKFDLGPSQHDQPVNLDLSKCTAEKVFAHLDSMEGSNSKRGVDLRLSPVSESDPRIPCLVQLTDVSQSDLRNLADHTFLVLRKPDNTYDCWFAVSISPDDSTESLSGLPQSTKSQSVNDLDRGKILLNGSNGHSHRLHMINTGQILTASAFSRLNIEHSGIWIGAQETEVV